MSRPLRSKEGNDEGIRHRPGGRPCPHHRERQGGQAGRRLGRRPSRRHRGSRHRLLRPRPERRRLHSADGRVQGIPVRRRPDPGRLLQARGAPHREGDPHLPDDRPADPAALPGRLRLRDADRRPRPLGRRRERPRHPRDQRHGGGPRAEPDPVHGSPRRRPGRPPRRPLRLQPDEEGARRVDDRPRRRRDPPGRQHGRGGLEGGLRRPHARGDPRRAPRAPQGHRRHRGAAAAPGNRQAGVHLARPRSRRDHGGGPQALGRSDDGSPHLEGQDRILREDQGRQEGGRRGSPRRPAGAEGPGQARDVRPRRGDDAGDDPARPQAPRRARVRRSSSHRRRDRRPSPHARLRALHARRDAGARHGHARHLGRHPAHRGPRGRVRAEVHAPLQLPVLLGRRGEALRLPGPA